MIKPALDKVLWRRIAAEDRAQIAPFFGWMFAGGTTFLATAVNGLHSIPATVACIVMFGGGMFKGLADSTSVMQREMTLEKAAKTNLLRIYASSLVPGAQVIPRLLDTRHERYRYNANSGGLGMM